MSKDKSNAAVGLAVILIILVCAIVAVITCPECGGEVEECEYRAVVSKYGATVCVNHSEAIK